MGDHPNGPSQVFIDSKNESLCQILENEEFVKQNEGQLISIQELFRMNPVKFLG